MTNTTKKNVTKKNSEVNSELEALKAQLEALKSVNEALVKNNEELNAKNEELTKKSVKRTSTKKLEKEERDARIEEERRAFFEAIHNKCKEFTEYKYNEENKYYQLKTNDNIQLTILIRDDNSYNVQVRCTATVKDKFFNAFHYFAFETKAGLYASVSYNHKETVLNALEQFKA